MCADSDVFSAAQSGSGISTAKSFLPLQPSGPTAVATPAKKPSIVPTLGKLGDSCFLAMKS